MDVFPAVYDLSNQFKSNDDEDLISANRYSPEFFIKPQHMRYKFVGPTGQGLKYIGNGKLMVTYEIDSYENPRLLPLIYELKPSDTHNKQRIGFVGIPRDGDGQHILLVGVALLANGLHKTADRSQLVDSLKKMCHVFDLVLSKLFIHLIIAPRVHHKTRRIG